MHIFYIFIWVVGMAITSLEAWGLQFENAKIHWKSRESSHFEIYYIEYS